MYRLINGKQKLMMKAHGVELFTQFVISVGQSCFAKFSSIVLEHQPECHNDAALYFGQLVRRRVRQRWVCRLPRRRKWCRRAGIDHRGFVVPTGFRSVVALHAWVGVRHTQGQSPLLRLNPARLRWDNHGVAEIDGAPLSIGQTRHCILTINLWAFDWLCVIHWISI